MPRSDPVKRKQYNDKWRADHPEYRRWRSILQHYGLTKEQYLDMLAEQDGKCLMCKRPPRKEWLAVHHNHRTGKVICLLDKGCNNVLARFENDPLLLPRFLNLLQRSI